MLKYKKAFQDLKDAFIKVLVLTHFILKLLEILIA